MFSLNVILQTLAVVVLLPLSIAAPAPDSIFLLQSSTFKPMGCSTTFHPTSILRQVPSPFACFSRCSEKQIAAYSQLQSGVLCACGGEDMISDITIEKCRDNTWYLFNNSELSSSATSSTSTEETATTESGTAATAEAGETSKTAGGYKLRKRDRLMPFVMMRKKSLASEKRSTKTIETSQ
ncbi:uncharacterized protein I303_104405 [Kwoniella dejecticola CBS 10117]|uniref:WSC domain-containing protein n=1 Tax=Kwoniella dejecticola CBS 10117 TaxID=1296121 RepID=A0A1A6A5E4_9TREE|nr:uncharacterized protein I303_04616 [Kwoniella dejecticola CBS 10117]OBR85283.1 hypothetical protein I303_04616 [Kwoniella dejecticola CBS 10117]